MSQRHFILGSNSSRSGLLMSLRSSSRHGLSIMEVLFAIGVLTVGLLGIASILPVALDNARTALDSDRSVEEINNRAALELARIGDRMDRITVANNSRVAFESTNTVWSGRRYRELGLADFPSEFVIDPWFLFASDNLRDDSGPNPDANRNAYNRGLFPCYDARYEPITLSPSASIGNSTWDTPRLARVALPLADSAGHPSYLLAEQLARNADDLSLIQATDSTKAPGLFVKQANSPAVSPATTEVSGHYSSIVMMRRTSASNLYEATVVTMRDRQVLISPSDMPIPNSGNPPAIFPTVGSPHPAFNLTPFVAAAPDTRNPPNSSLVYEGETLGYVTYAPSPFVGGGGGEFSFRHSAFSSPDIRSGDWVLLMRREYGVNPNDVTPISNSSPPYPEPTGIPGRLLYEWYRVSSVSQPPTLDDEDNPTYYETTITVRGADWVFHPSQIHTDDFGFLPPYPNFQTNSNIYPPLLNSIRPVYDSSVVGHPKLGTVIVLMPSVVGVQKFQIQL